MLNNNKDKMHPEDIRNMIIFVIASGLVWLMFDTFILKPQTEALKKARAVREHVLKENPQALHETFVKRKDALKGGDRLPFQSGEVEGTISLKGARIDDLSLRNYYETLKKEKHVVLLKPEGVESARYIDYGWVSSDKTLKLPNAQTMWKVEGSPRLQSGKPVKLVWDNGQGLTFQRLINIDSRYVFIIKQSVINNTGKPVKLHPFARITQIGIPHHDGRRTWISHEGPVGVLDNILVEKTYEGLAKKKAEPEESNRGWVGLSDKYWLTALIPQQDVSTQYSFDFTPDPLDKERNRYDTDFTAQAVTIPAGGKGEYDYHLFTGVKKVAELDAYSKALGIDKLDLAVDFGWFWFLTKPFFWCLHTLNKLVGNMGVAIILMTILVRGAAFPLTNISYRSFAKMKVVAPKLAELREKFGDDKAKLQQAIVEVYQKEGVNPMSGCFPILVQIPIFFAFYKTIFVTIEIRQAPFFGWIHDLAAPDPTSVFNLFGLLPYDVPASLVIGVWPCLMLVATLIQKQLNPPPQDKIQKDMMTFFPFFITYVMSHFASGLVIYWTFSAFMGILQQTLIMRSMNVPIYIFNKDHYREKIEEQVEKGPDVHPFVEMAEEEAEDALFGEDSAPKKPIKPPKPRKSKKKKK